MGEPSPSQNYQRETSSQPIYWAGSKRGVARLPFLGQALYIHQ